MTEPATSPEIQVHQAVQAGYLNRATADNLLPWLLRSAHREYQPQLHALIAAQRWEELERLFWTVIPFGTGGRRGEMAELGSATINARTIAESAAGLASYAETQCSRDHWHVVIACDTRHRSQEFARLTAQVFAARGWQVFLFPQPRATPQLSFAVRRLRCAVGVMISASHNPPADNGFKAYWSDGGQILPPHDAGIIAAVAECGEIPLADFDDSVSRETVILTGPELDTAYYHAVAELACHTLRNVRAWYSPLHGVGASSIYEVLRLAGFTGVELDPVQAQPDGSFSTVPDQLPNPERFAALGPAIAAARQRDIPLVLASDPDADRIAFAVRNPAGDYVPLSGNQMGALITDFALRHRQAAGKLSPEDYVLETLVTTPLIGRIARHYGVQVRDDLLVGFKYLARVVEERGGEHFVFAAEESLGYLAGDYCRDKDAAIGALWGLELAAELHAAGQTLLDRWDELSITHGVHEERQVTHTCRGSTGQQQISGLMNQLRNQPPAGFGPVTWTTVTDYQQQEIRSLPANTHLAPHSSPTSNLLVFSGASDIFSYRLAARPSGTEPKIKFYVFAAAAPCPELVTQRSSVSAALDQLEQGLDEWFRSHQ